MNLNKIKKKIIKLKKKIIKYSYFYFNKNKNLIENEKYDTLFKKLQDLEKLHPKYKINSPTNKINYILCEKFKKKKHKIPMLSIKSLYTFKELSKFININIKKYYNINFCCELKIDGIAVSLIYKKNILKYSLTRGNGIYGENIINNVKEIKCIPKILKNKNKINKIEIRGEIFITKKNFLYINKNNKFSNCRNLTSGTIRQLNPYVTKKRKLSFIAYDIIINNNRNIFNNQFNSLNYIKKLGFKINKYTKICNSLKDIKKYFNNIKNKRNNLNFDIDGIVIKINDKLIQEILNYNNNYIKWAVSLKFYSSTKVSKVKNIKFNVGQSGIIVPIIYIKKIYLSCSKIKKINIYNLKIYKKMNICINDKVLITKQGDIIPKIIKVIKSKNNKKFLLPNKCPSCKKNLNLNSKIIKCNNNLNCNSKLLNKIIIFVSNKGFNIIGLGKKTIYLLIKYKIIKKITDLFNLNISKLITLPLIKYKKAKKILNNINNSIKKVKLYNVLYSLCIPKIGLSTSIYISNKLKKLDNFINIKKYNLYHKINKIGKLKIKSIKNYINNKIFYKNLKSLNKIIKKKIK